MLSRLTTSLAGVLLLVYGVIAGLSPLPAGVFFVVLGFLMIAAANPSARPAVRRLRRRWPWFNAIVKALGKRGPRTIKGVVLETDPGDPRTRPTPPT
ncbi:MAG: hypothetical protein ABL957_16730 [Parvularculaceae bacterium]